MEQYFKILIGSPTRKTFRKGNIRMDLKAIGANARNRVDSAQDGDYC